MKKGWSKNHKKIERTFAGLVEDVDEGIVYARVFEDESEVELVGEFPLSLFPRTPEIGQEFSMYEERSPKGYLCRRISMYNPPPWTARELKDAERKAKELWAWINENVGVKL